MDINGVLNIILPIVFIAVGVALVVFVIELIKMVKNANATIADIKKQVDPLLANVENITNDIKPAIAKVDPLMDRVQLTVDSVNLEMMRVDQILEDVSEIAETASSATAAVDSITNVPLQAVNNVAERVRSAFRGKHASAESEQLAEQRVAVAQALEDYKAAEKKAKHGNVSRDAAKLDQGSGAGDDDPITAKIPEPTRERRHSADDGSPVAGAEPVIDPRVIAESPFFDETSNAR